MFADGWQPCCSELCVFGNTFTEVRQMQIRSFQQLGIRRVVRILLRSGHFSDGGGHYWKNAENCGKILCMFFCDFSIVTGDIHPCPPAGYTPVRYAPWNSDKCLKRTIYFIRHHHFSLLKSLQLKFSFNFVSCHRKNSTQCFPYKHD